MRFPVEQWTFCFWSVGGDGVEDVDQHQEEGDKESLGEEDLKKDKQDLKALSEKLLGESFHVSVCEQSAKIRFCRRRF